MTHQHGTAQSPRTGSGPDADGMPDAAGQPETGHSMWWMVACCAPMVLLTLAILLGVFGPR